MKRLMLIVHGQHRFAGQLTDKGDLATQILADRLHPLLQGRVLIISAPTVQAKETAKILMAKFGAVISVSMSTSDDLWSDPQKPANLPAVTKLVDAWEDSVDTLVFVTHPEIAEGFQAICGGRLGQDWESDDLDHGEAVVIDFPKKRRFFFCQK